MKLYTEEQIKILLNALIDIKNWNEELEDEWEDCGYRAIEAINEFADKEEIELPSDEELAILFHNKYEELAPKFGYETRMETKEFKKDSNNGKLMIAVCREILQILNQNNNL